ncbi:hypothetical protein PROFUN_07849 [Planoprotostelium fungivorum]|uniref:Uncharacterized protein n=1 Tax=Planoprotostelium fungivorum TaxID=1890364 RepID=A0A2P6NLB6_9EUKA|nr:hypothetical protein PROFUN_07849 [Planoprotostelium fungivorum]
MLTNVGQHLFLSIFEPQLIQTEKTISVILGLILIKNLIIVNTFLIFIKLRQDVSQGSYDNVIQDYQTGCTRGELCAKYKLSYLKLKIILRDEHSSKIPSAYVANIKTRLQNKSTTKTEVMGLYKISYRALNHSLSEPKLHF